MTLNQWRGTLTWAQVARKLSDCTDANAMPIREARLLRLRQGKSKPRGDELLALERLTDGEVMEFTDWRDSPRMGKR